MTNREWGNIGTNYIRSMVALAFQGFFIMVIVGIYSVLVKDLSTATDLHDVVMKMVPPLSSVCRCLRSSITKSIFNALKKGNEYDLKCNETIQETAGLSCKAG